MFLSKYLATNGVCSRRKAVELVKSGEVLVNGKVEKDVTYMVKPSDKVKHKDVIIKPQKNVYILLNKPKDYITTLSDERGRKTVIDLIQNKSIGRIYPVGRLDRSTTGLLLLTNDGNLAQKLSHPSYEIRKRYHVELDKPFKRGDFLKLSQGIKLEDGFIRPDAISCLNDKKNKKISIELHSGKNRIVRRMFEYFDYKIKKLDRVMYAGLPKKGLLVGYWRFLTKEEVDQLKKL